MRTLTAIAAALGFFLATSAPSLAATTDHTAIELAAAKQKVDLSTTFSAKTTKVNCKLKKNAKNKACAKKK